MRNIGGIIILDFIDMDRNDDRDKVFQALVEELKKDKAKTTVLRISEMGLVQMTRKRTEESLMQKMTVDCPYCDGNGHVKSPATISYEVIRELLREFSRSTHEGFVVKAHPHVADRLLEEDKIFVDELKSKHSKKVVVKSFVDYHLEHFEIAPMRFE